MGCISSSQKQRANRVERSLTRSCCGSHKPPSLHPPGGLATVVDIWAAHGAAEHVRLRPRGIAGGARPRAAQHRGAWPGRIGVSAAGARGTSTDLSVARARAPLPAWWLMPFCRGEGSGGSGRCSIWTGWYGRRGRVSTNFAVQKATVAGRGGRTGRGTRDARARVYDQMGNTLRADREQSDVIIDSAATPPGK